LKIETRNLKFGKGLFSSLIIEEGQAYNLIINPTGTGNAVSNNVTFNPWSTQSFRKTEIWGQGPEVSKQ
jgi:hypothetical protein